MFRPVSLLLFVTCFSFHAFGHSKKVHNMSTVTIQKILNLIHDPQAKIKVNTNFAAAHWQTEVSPPFPDSWPLKPSSKITTYIFSAAKKPGTVDSKSVSTPWGKVVYSVDNEQNLNFELLTNAPQDLGVQSARSLSIEDRALLAKSSSLYSSLRQLSEPKEIPRHLDKQVKDYFCTWAKANSVLFQELHKSDLGNFYAALNCH